jgi:GT2 family glycosyltransferase
MTALRAPALDPGHLRVAVVVVTYEAERFVEDCFGSLRRADVAGASVEVIAVDNGSRDGTVRLLRERFPEVTVIENGRNLGFAEGNNVGIRLALERGAEFVYLLNPDTEVAPGFLREALEVARARPDDGAVQSLLLLADERDLVNTAGNAVHFLGLGYCTRFREPAASVPDAPAEIAFASGACVLLRASALRAAGLLDEALFLYQEDLDLGWRMRLAGWGAVLAPRSLVFHEYAFSRNPEKFYFLERNRALVLLKNLRLRNLLLLSPALLAGEIGLAAVALRGGWFRQKLRAWGHLLTPTAWRHVRAGRTAQRSIRRVEDAEIVRLWSGDVVFEGLAGPWLDRFANPLMRLAWRALRPLLR